MNTESESKGGQDDIQYPKMIRRWGIWPVNIGLFFFYNNIVSIFVIVVALFIMSASGVTDEAIISEKMGGLSVISTLLTLGLTLIYSRRFYFSKMHKVVHEKHDATPEERA